MGMDVIWAAIIGAFVAFLFVRLAEFLSHYYQGKLTHYQALALLHGHLQGYLNIVDENLLYLKGLQDSTQKGVMHTGVFGLTAFPIDSSYYAKLENLELMNALHNLDTWLRRCNNELEVFKNAYTRACDAYAQKSINADGFRDQVGFFADNVGVYQGFLSNVSEEIFRTLAICRVRLKKDQPLGSWLVHRIMRIEFTKVGEKDLNDQLKQLKKEHKAKPKPGGTSQSGADGS